MIFEAADQRIFICRASWPVETGPELLEHSANSAKTTIYALMAKLLP
jgi:hypothetical protein